MVLLGCSHSCRYFHYDAPLSWVYLQIEFASKTGGEETLHTVCRQGFSLSPVSPEADVRDFVINCVDLGFFSTLKFLNMLKTTQYNELFLSFMNQVMAIKTNIYAVVIFF